MRRLIFLDIDGVLNAHAYDNHSDIESSTIERDCVAALNLLIDASNPQIVVSSAWRYMIGLNWRTPTNKIPVDRLSRDPKGAMTLRGFEYLLRTYGVRAKGRLIGVTARDEEIPTRGEQITAWLGRHGRRPYIVVDDGGKVPGTTEWSDLGLSVHPVVWTHGSRGLAVHDLAKALELLASQTDPH